MKSVESMIVFECKGTIKSWVFRINRMKFDGFDLPWRFVVEE